MDIGSGYSYIRQQYVSEEYVYKNESYYKSKDIVKNQLVSRFYQP